MRAGPPRSDAGWPFQADNGSARKATGGKLANLPVSESKRAPFGSPTRERGNKFDLQDRRPGRSATRFPSLTRRGYRTSLGRLRAYCCQAGKPDLFLSKRIQVPGSTDVQSVVGNRGSGGAALAKLGVLRDDDGFFGTGFQHGNDARFQRRE